MNLYRTPQNPTDIYYTLGENVVRWQRGATDWIAESSKLPENIEKIDFKDIPQDLQEEIMAISIRLRAVNHTVGSG